MVDPKNEVVSILLNRELFDEFICLKYIKS